MNESLFWRWYALMMVGLFFLVTGWMGVLIRWPYGAVVGTIISLCGAVLAIASFRKASRYG